MMPLKPECMYADCLLCTYPVGPVLTDPTLSFLLQVACNALGPSRVKACVLSPPSLDLRSVYLAPTATQIFAPMAYVAQ